MPLALVKLGLLVLLMSAATGLAEKSSSHSNGHSQGKSHSQQQQHRNTGHRQHHQTQQPHHRQAQQHQDAVNAKRASLADFKRASLADFKRSKHRQGQHHYKELDMSRHFREPSHLPASSGSNDAAAAPKRNFYWDVCSRWVNGQEKLFVCRKPVVQ